VSDTETTDDAGGRPPRNPTVLYAIVAALLVVIIVVAAYLLITKAFPALRGDKEPTAVAKGESTATSVPTFTPGPTRAPTATLLPAPTPTVGVPVMQDTDAPLFELKSAGGRPSTEWTGFFGQVLDAQGNPLADVPLIVWYADAEGRPAELVNSPDSPIATTAADGSYEMRLADAPLSGVWSIQVLTDDGGPASKLFQFATSDDPATGFQQIQVIWQKLP
jgi:hypothetical protein